MTPRECKIANDASFRRLDEWDFMFARHAALIAQVNYKKTLKPEELTIAHARKKTRPKEEAPVVDIEQHRRARNALEESRKRVPWGS